MRSAFLDRSRLPVPRGGAAQGPLAGLDFTAKETFDVAGEPSCFGNPDWRAGAAVPSKDALAVERLLDAGARLTARTTADELLFSLVGDNHHYGAPVNPRVAGGFTGGSSSGAASSVASGSCDFALGSDTGGSVRVPAALCGLFGLRPTFGRVPREGSVLLAESMDCVGWLTASAGLLGVVGQVLLDEGSDASPLRSVLWCPELWEVADRDVRDPLLGLVPALGELADVRRVPLPDGIDLSQNVESYRAISSREFWERHGPWVETTAPSIGGSVAERVRFGSELTGDEVALAARWRERLKAAMGDLIEPGTVLCLPTAPCSFLPRSSGAHELDEFRARVLRLTSLASLCGLPQLAMPVYRSEGPPLSLSLIGWQGSDEVLMDLARSAAPLLAP